MSRSVRGRRLVVLLEIGTCLAVTDPERHFAAEGRLVEPVCPSGVCPCREARLSGA